MDRIAAFAKRRKLQSPRPPASDLRNKAVYFADGVDPDSMREVMTMHRMVRVHDRMVGEFFVVPDPSKPGQRVQMMAMMRGLHVVSPEYLQTSGERGVRISFKAALGIKRVFWMTPEFREAHETLGKIIEDLVNLVTSKWRMIVGREEFMRETDNRQQGPRRVWRTMDAICLCTKREKKHDADLREQSAIVVDRRSAIGNRRSPSSSSPLSSSSS